LSFPSLYSKPKTLKDNNFKDFITITGAALHNLKNLDVKIPRNKLVVITGLSGSGKSSLAFDTLYAEGQRRYVESLSSYARQFLGKLNKPKVSSIKGISPAIAIEQKVNSTNPRSTVGTTTEIYDYLKLLYARVGKTFSPISGELVKKDTISDVIDRVLSMDEGTKLLLLSPIHATEERDLPTLVKIMDQQGFSRLKTESGIVRIDEFNTEYQGFLYLVVDRVVVQRGEDFVNRLSDSVQTAFYEGKGECILENVKSSEQLYFSNRFEKDGITFMDPNVHFFSFNNPYGACPKCEGYGNTIGIDEDLVIPNNTLSVYDDAVLPWKSDSFKHFKEDLVLNAYKFDFPIHKPVFELSDQQYQLLWEGNEYFEGLNGFFSYLEEKSYKIQYRVMLSRYRGKTKCPECQGRRLRKEAEYVKIGGKNIMELVDLPIDEVLDFFKNLKLDPYREKIAKRLLKEVVNRLTFLNDVGLSYLTLNRNSNTLSGGESQRINLATSLGSSLVGSMYILDEPSIGLHSRDTEKLIKVLKKLRDLGNTVIVVEHDEDIIRVADHIIDIGPEAGSFGGELVAEGNFEQILKSDSLTANYLNGSLRIDVPPKRRAKKKFIEIKGAREHNLQNVNVQIPLNALSVITGVSGSGKSTLIRDILYPALQRIIHKYGEKAGRFTEISGDLETLQNVEFINQNPIGRSSRSNPVTYIKAYDEIRGLFTDQKLSQVRGYKAKHFSFNVDGGRCDACKGEGEVTIEMQFMADVHIECETCKGKRFKKEILEIEFHGRNINDILETTVDEAILFFEETKQKRIVQKLKPLQDVGLGYVQLGQASSTLSGGEAQRIKLASFLVKGSNSDKTLFIFDEPTTGLHFHDIKKLLDSFNALIGKGHSIVVIEHNMELIKCADYIIDLGPEGGKHGGQVIGQGLPEELVLNEKSYTGKYLKEKLEI
jgi:excinuclease ABC subunit A